MKIIGNFAKKLGKKIEKSYKGSFDVRISPEIHKRAKQIAVRKEFQ